MSKDGKQETTSRNVSTPTAPDYVKDGIKGLGQAVINLGNRNPSDYVPGPTDLHMQSFDLARRMGSRYGATAIPDMYAGGSDAIRLPNQPGGGNSLFAGLDVQTPVNYDYGAIGQDWAQRDPSFRRNFDRLDEQGHANIAQVLGLPVPAVNFEDFTRYHIEHGDPLTSDMEARFRQLSGAQPQARSGRGSSGDFTDLVDMGDGRWAPGGGSNTPFATMGKVSPDAPMMPGYDPQNPLSMYGDAADIARQVSTAGAQFADYSPVYSLLANNSPRGAASRVQSESLLDGWENYMNPYTDTVVDRTIDSTKEEQARVEAQRAATAAGSGAHRGTRNAIFEALSQIDRERQLGDLEWNMRDAAYNSGMDRSADDANRRQAAGTTNAQLATQVSMANAQNDLQRLLTGASLMHSGIGDNQDAAESALDRALRGADSLRTTGNVQEQNERSAIALLSDLGDRKRAIQQQEDNAELGHLSTILNMFGSLPFSQVTGIQGSQSGTTTTTPGTLDWVNAGANLAGSLLGTGGLGGLRPPPGPTP